MRSLAGVLALTLLAPLASAAPTAPAPAVPPEAEAPASQPRVARAKIPLRVVRVMPESHQALLFDRSRSTHVLAEVGGTVDGYTVEAIDDDQVTLLFQGTRVVLAAPALAAAPRPPRVARASPARRAAAMAPAAPAELRATAALAPAPPVDGRSEVPLPPASPGDGDSDVPVTPEIPAPGVAVAVAAGPADQAPVDPYSEATTRTAPAATASGTPGPEASAPAEGLVRAAAPAPAGAAPALPGLPRPPAMPPARAPDPAAAPSDPPAAPAARSDTVTLRRTEVERALADFAKLTLAVHGSFTASGVRIDGVGEGSIFQRIGLHAGDVIASVDGAPLRTLDDTATLYARAGKALGFTAQVVRHGAPVALHVAIQ